MNNSLNGQTSVLNADLTNDELDDAQLEAISGGMACSTANAIARTYGLASNVSIDLGNYGTGYFMAGIAYGWAKSGCD